MTDEFEDDEVVKKIALITRRAPHGSIYAYEGLETVLIMAAYDQDISMVFIDDGVYMLKADQDTTAIGIKGFVKTLTALEDYDVEKMYVDKISMEERGLTKEDLAVDVEVLESAEIAKILAEQDAIIS